MSSHIVSDDNPLPTAILQQLATAGALDEISNITDAVRSHIFWHGKRDKVTGKLRASMLFCVYQTTKNGPQNGFRLCLVHQGFYIASDAKVEGEPEDDIDRLEAFIPQGHMEVVVLGAGNDETAVEDREVVALNAGNDQTAVEDREAAALGAGDFETALENSD